MALDYNYLTAITIEHHIPRLVDNIYESSAFLTFLRNQGVVVPGGTKIKEPLKYAKNTARGWYEGWDTVDVSIPDNLTAAIYEWGRAYVSVGISKEDEEENSGKEAILNLLQIKMDDAEMSLKDFLADGIFSGSSSKGIIGMDTAINTGTYGGIAGATYTWWQSGVDTSSHTAANMKDSTNASFIHTLLRTGWASCQHLGYAPNFIVTTQECFDIYEHTLQANQRYNYKSEAARQIADAGFQVLEFRGIPFMVDDKSPLGRMYMGNTEFLKLRYHPASNFTFTGFKVPTNQIGRVGQVLFTGQLCLSNRRMFYKWTGLPANY